MQFSSESGKKVKKKKNELFGRHQCSLPSYSVLKRQEDSLFCQGEYFPKPRKRSILRMRLQEDSGIRPRPHGLHSGEVSSMSQLQTQGSSFPSTEHVSTDKESYPYNSQPPLPLQNICKVFLNPEHGNDCIEGDGTAPQPPAPSTTYPSPNPQGST